MITEINQISKLSSTTEPKGVKVGDMLLIDGDNITIFKEGTEKLRKEIEDLMDKLFED